MYIAPVSAQHETVNAFLLFRKIAANTKILPAFFVKKNF